ncbi:TonB-dependent receptor plug domain-containing protein [Opitutus sp. ER46]|uniref:TonB-dependent siderophore receptor n=1 Tax=Opitutus sp. ER46 TaxID=2161864 RepID=UPI001304A365|nr:TonB-dependent receptor plug domain-containing protein [Opitutus sp. ER46]
MIPPPRSRASRPSLAAVLLLAALLPAARAQVAPAPAEAPAGATQVAPVAATGDTIVLSPFEVVTDRDQGFVAANALAGGRLNLSLRDTPVAYSVINRELIDALGLNDLSEAAEWTTNSFKFPDGAGGGDLYNLTVPVSVRGIASSNALRQRNFFVYFSENDSYNIERFDFGRGPNQVLFGNGAMGGTQVTMTKRARFDKPFRTVDVGYGSWGNQRAVLDVNQPLGPRAALRTSLLWSDRDGWRDREMEQKQAAFLTGTVKLFRDVELRVEGEIGEIRRRTPDAKLQDRFAGWDGAYTGGYLATLPGNSGALGINRNGAGYFVLNAAGDPGTLYGYTNWAITRGAGDTSSTYAGTYLQGSLPAWNQSGATLLNAVNVAPNRFDRALANSKFRLPSRAFTNAPDLPLLDSDFRDLQATLSKRIGDDLFVEIAADMNGVKNDINRLEGSAINTYIDINPTLPGGANNPNFLRPYGDGQYSVSDINTEAKSIRAAVAYMLDAGKWGNYSFNLSGGLTNQLVERRNRVLATGIANTTQLADLRQWGNIDYALRERFYWGDGGAVTTPTGTLRYIDPTGVAGTVTPQWVPMAAGSDSSNNISDNDSDFNYFLASTNVKLFSGRVVLLGAARFDESRQEVRYLKRIGDFPENWDLKTLYWRPDAPADWSDLTYTPVGSSSPTYAITRPRSANAAGVQVANPAYANARFADDFNPPPIVGRGWTPSVGSMVHVTKWLSVFGNYSEAFAFNTAAAPDVNGRLLPVVEGQGWDAGIRLFFFDERLSVTASTYRNEEFGNYIDPTSVTNQINTLYQANVLGDTTAGGRNHRDAADINGLVRDTRTRIAKGYEFEVVANLTRNWRTILNVGLPKVTEQDYAPYTRAYVAHNADLFKAILQDAGGEVGADGVAVRRTGVADTGTGGSEAQGNEATRAVNAYNTLYSNVRNFVVNPRRSTTAPDTVNLFTDYTFRDGFLRGVRLGAGANWRGSRVVGYRGGDTIVNPANPTAAIDDPTVDGYTPVWAPGAILVTANLGYTWKLKQGRAVTVNLRVSNLLNEDDVIWTDTTSTLRPKGGDLTTPARETVFVPYAYQTPRAYYLTAKFSF